MKKIISMMFCLTMGMSSVMADELTVSDITIPQGGKATLSVSLTNTGTYRQLFEFVLTLPEKVTLVANSQKLSERFQSTTSLSYSEQSERVYKFICVPAGTNTTPISGASGVLMTVDLQADASLAVGTPSLTGNVTNIELTTSEATSWNPANQTFNITIGEPADPRIILDENNTDEFDDADKVDVRVRRTIVAGVWNTIVLPFPMDEQQIISCFGADVQIAELTSVNLENVTVAGKDVKSLRLGFSSVNPLTELKASSSNFLQFTRISSAVALSILRSASIALKKSSSYPSGYSGSLIISFNFSVDIAC